jgi:glycosyltransferase involved in cell wall biosynthesis
MPLYNEKATAGIIIEKVLALDIELELIIINNGSTDGTSEVIRQYAKRSNVRIIDKHENIGKGDGIITGVEYATGKYTVIQDGDLEYDPNDFLKMIELAETKKALAVFGSRTLNPDSGISYNRYLWGGKLLTFVANLLFNVGITDESTCYKMLRTDILKTMNLESRQFEFCPEVVGKLGRNKIKIYEVPVNYYPRKFEEGKKIRWTDGVTAIATLIKYRLQPFSKLAIETNKKASNQR